MSDMVSIRGAVTARNNAEEIAEASRRLFEKILFKNGITDGDIVNVLISTTSDITAFYPARAVRETGHNVALFSCQEPNINGSLKGCIRIMVTAASEHAPRGIYLNGARTLRPDITAAWSIALDGPSGAGKSTVAKLVAKQLGITYLDTGALYRALGLRAIRGGVDTHDGAAVEKALAAADVKLEYVGGVQHVVLDGEDVSAAIRTPEVSMAASAVSAVPFVREKLLDLQRGIAASSCVILDGRDIGTVVLPTAEFKYFLTASAEIRAKRRYEELKAKGESVTFESVLEDVNIRDKNDSTRAVAPLKKAFDATEINSDGMTAENVAKFIIDGVKKDL